VCACVRVHALVRACVGGCVRWWVRALVCACARAHVCVHVCVSE
jgi:hypothetical protein